MPSSRWRLEGTEPPSCLLFGVPASKSNRRIVAPGGSNGGSIHPGELRQPSLCRFFQFMREEIFLPAVERKSRHAFVFRPGAIYEYLENKVEDDSLTPWRRDAFIPLAP